VKKAGFYAVYMKKAGSYAVYMNKAGFHANFDHDHLIPVFKKM
jgi:hypothetical protein